MGSGVFNLVAVALLLYAVAVAGRPAGIDRQSELELAVDKKLKELNKPAVKTIQSEDGDIIDCVDINKQPAMDHPLLKNHVIRVPTNFEPKESNKNLLGIHPWHKSGTCPVGTVPIVRVMKEVLMTAAASSSLDDFGKKPPGAVVKQMQVNSLNESKTNFLGIPGNHSLGVVGTMGSGYIGAKAEIDIWEPFVEHPDEYSSSQIWIQGGPASTDSIEAGWMVNPSLGGGKRSRLFTYWRTDDGKTTQGCFNFLCPGFVQTSNLIGIGAALNPISQYAKSVLNLKYYISKDMKTNDWHMMIDNEWVGYFPSEILNYLKKHADVVQFGGDVYTTRLLHAPHTRTGMGSNYLSEQGYCRAAAISRFNVQLLNGVLVEPPAAYQVNIEPECYSTCLAPYEYNRFLFGGYGRDPDDCP